jgi:ABC-type bacteriocin/lantibiotic exporter with double-glycine peptidase domain
MSTNLLPIEHRSQEADAGCLAACVQMVMGNLGITVSQNELNRLLELTPAGVPTPRLLRLERYGVQATIQRGDQNDLLEAIDPGAPPILFVCTGQLSYWDIDTQHALLVSGYDGPDLLLNDPAFPDAPQRVHIDELMLAWDEFDNTHTLITR